MSERYDFVRQDVILHELTESGRVMVNDLAEKLGVSAVTIRKDLDALEQRALLRRVRGGAVAAGSAEEGAFADRMRRDANVKRALAREVASLVQDGDVIAIDSSTTSYYLAQELVDRDELIVVTFGMRAAMHLMDNSTATVVMPGGVLRRASGAMVGSFGNALEGRGRIDKGFFGVAALSPQLGMLELSSEEAVTKRHLVASCDAVYVSLASTKIGGFGLHPYAATGEVTRLFTDERAGERFVDDWHTVGVPVTRVAGTAAMLDEHDRSIDEFTARSLRVVEQ